LTFHVVSYLDLVRGGLGTYGQSLPEFAFFGPPEGFPSGIKPNVSGPQTLNGTEHYGLNLSPSSITKTGRNVVFSYFILEYVGEEASSQSSDHSVHSSVSCTMLRLDDNKYWRDYGSDNQTSKGMLYHTNQMDEH